MGGAEPVHSVAESLGCTLTYMNSGDVFGYYENVVICVWAERASPESVQALAEVSAAVAARHRWLSSLHVVTNMAALPAAAERREMERLVKDYEKRVVCIPLLIEGGGFWASAMRSLYTSMHFVRASTYKTQVFTDCHALAQWFQPVHFRASGGAFSAEKICEVVSELVALSEGRR